MTEESFDPATGELPAQEITTDMPRGAERTASGEIVQTVALTGGMFLDMLEDGQLSADLHDKLADLGAKMTDINNATGNKAKGKVTIDVELIKDGEHFTAQATVKVKEPELPRPKSVLWSDERNNFTRFPPNQTQMFGTRRPVRNI